MVLSLAMEEAMVVQLGRLLQTPRAGIGQVPVVVALADIQAVAEGVELALEIRVCRGTAVAVPVGARACSGLDHRAPAQVRAVVVAAVVATVAMAAPMAAQGMAGPEVATV